MQDLFIKYVNADLETHPGQLMLVFESAQAFNKKNSGHQDPYLQNVSFPHSEIFKLVINTCKALSPHIKTNYPWLFVRSEIGVCNGEGMSKIIPFNSEGMSKIIPFNSDIRLIALEGTFSWAMMDNGCKECRLNESYERDKIKNNKRVNCIICDQLMVRNILDNIINGECLYESGIRFLEEAAYKIVKKAKIANKKGCFVERSWINPAILRNKYNHGKNQFSFFVLGCVGYSLLSFLKEKKNKKK